MLGRIFGGARLGVVRGRKLRRDADALRALVQSAYEEGVSDGVALNGAAPSPEGLATMWNNSDAKAERDGA